MALTKVTTGTIASETIKSANIEDGAIVNADVNASAAIVASKLSGVESGLTSVQTFTSSGTWTKPSGITKVIVEVQGAGGGGSCDSSINNANTGAGGGYAKKFLNVSSISTSTITVGSGGAGIAQAGTPNAGGASSWVDGTNTITGNGGPGGSPNSNASANRSAAGGTATGGDINIQGGPSSSYFYSNGGFGHSFFGIPGTGPDAIAEPAVALKNGIGYGSGGGGRATSLGAGNSGSGAGGIIIVWEFK